jgi:hypothetical protein
VLVALTVDSLFVQGYFNSLNRIQVITPSSYPDRSLLASIKSLFKPDDTPAPSSSTSSQESESPDNSNKSSAEPTESPESAPKPVTIVPLEGIPFKNLRNKSAYISALEKLYRQMSSTWFTPVELFQVCFACFLPLLFT